MSCNDLSPRIRQRQRSRRLAGLAVVVGLAAASATFSCAALDRNATATPAVTSTTSTGATASPPATTESPAPPLPEPGTWRLLPAAPDPAIYRIQSVSVWTGTELLVNASGGVAGGTVGAAYNPVANSWRVLPSNPYPQRMTESGDDAVWTGNEMLTFGTSNAAYNPATNKWRALTPPPFAGALFASWTGHRVLVFGGGCCTTPGSYLASYDPAHDSWRSIAAGPLGEHVNAQSIWTGKDLVVFTTTKGAAYNPATNAWRSLTPPPANRIAGTPMTWTGAEVVIVGGLKADNASAYADGVAFNPTTNTWRKLPAMTFGRFAHVTVWTGTHLLVSGGNSFPGNVSTNTFTTPPNGFAYDPAPGSWSAIPKPPLTSRTGAVAVWTGNAMIVVSGYDIAYPYDLLTDGAIYLPGPAT